MRHLIGAFQFTPAVIALLFMNLIPLIGVFWFGWDAATIVFLYWLENVVIGILNVIKILTSQGGSKSNPQRRESLGSLVFLAGFFSVHYGLFCYGHYTFLSGTYETLPVWGEVFSSLFRPVLFWSILGLTLSHVVSMLVNYYGRGEYKTRSANTQMFMPYSRIILLHVVIVFSGLLAVAMGQGLAMLVLLVIMKIGFDLAAHLVEHSEKESLIAPSVN